jgi:ATP-dependent RNA helicase RhlB
LGKFCFIGYDAGFTGGDRQAGSGDIWQNPSPDSGMKTTTRYFCFMRKTIAQRTGRTVTIGRAKRRRTVKAPPLSGIAPDNFPELSVLAPEKGTLNCLKTEKKRHGHDRSGRRKRRQRPQWTAARFEVEKKEGTARFHDFNLPPSLMHGIADLDFRYCTPIQQQALPPALEGKDLIGRASTGMGKSAVFLVAIFSRLLREQQKKRKPGYPRALILAPTRELVIQIAKDARAIGKYTPLRIAAVYGGTDYRKQQDDLAKRPVDILVATPGRLLDFMGRRLVHLRKAGIVILDEADRMLDMGFIPDVRRIIYKTPPREERQTMLFSATMTDEVKQLSSQWCVDPVLIETEKEQVAVESVEQIVYMTTSEEKYHVVYNMITATDHERIIVFTNMKREAKSLSDRLRRDGVDCVLLTGDVPQDQRSSRLERFRSGRVKVMIATDVAGRGIHIEGISHVINYTLPYEPEDYVHRIGRTGRAGKSGISVSFADEKGAFYIPEIEEYLGCPMPCVQPDEALLVPPPPPVRRQKKSGKKRRR